MPAIGAVLVLHLGYRETGLILMGRFVVDAIACSVATLTIGAKAADMPGPFHTPVSRSWDRTTLGAIATTIAQTHGYQPKVQPALGALVIEHEDQTRESPMAFLTRLAARFDAVAKPVNGMLVLAPRGTAKTVTGLVLSEVVLRPRDVTQWRYRYEARDEAGAAGEKKRQGRRQNWDTGEAKLKEKTEGAPPYQDVRANTCKMVSRRASGGSSDGSA